MNIFKTQTTQKNTLRYIVLLKFFAILLITNSHMGGLYPKSLSRLDTGGALGNLLFFFCSGYALFYSNKNSFINYCKRRLIRIYPAIWITATLLSLVAGKDLSFKLLIYPTRYWFIEAILVFYVLYYFISKYLFKRLLYIILFLFVALFFVYYRHMNPSDVLNTSGKFVWIYYFISFLMGGYFARKKIQGARHYLSDLMSFIASYGAYNFIVFRCSGNSLLVFAVPCLIIAVISLFRVCVNENVLTLFNIRYLKGLIFFISNLTLEMYLVQYSVIECCGTLPNPFGFFVAIPSIVICAFLINKLVQVFLWLFCRSDTGS